MSLLHPESHSRGALAPDPQLLPTMCTARSPTSSSTSGRKGSQGRKDVGISTNSFPLLWQGHEKHSKCHTLSLRNLNREFASGPLTKWFILLNMLLIPIFMHPFRGWSKILIIIIMQLSYNTPVVKYLVFKIFYKDGSVRGTPKAICPSCFDITAGSLDLIGFYWEDLHYFCVFFE